jgi:phage tail-like protein
MALAAERVAVPSLDDARRCGSTPPPGDPCTPTVVSFDPPDGTILVALGSQDAEVCIHVTPGAVDGATPQLKIRPIAPIGADLVIDGVVGGGCRDRIVFRHAITAATADGEYELSLVGYGGAVAHITVAFSGRPPTSLSADRCALVLQATAAPVGVGLDSPPATWPPPPLLAVDDNGCVLAAWSVDEHGWVLVPDLRGGVALLQSSQGGVRASIQAAAAIVDAIFWHGTITVLTATAVSLYDLGGCPKDPAPLFAGFTAAVALGISDEGFLIVIDRGARPNVTYLRRDGSRALPPAAFDARGFYARHRSPAFVIDAVDGHYSLRPANAGRGCCVAPERPLTEDEALFFLLIDDLYDLRQRVAYPLSGTVILGPAAPADVLDAGRPGTQWHRLVLFGQIPDGCTVQIETRAFNDVLAGDPLFAEGWSAPVVVDSSAQVPVEAPGDERTAAGDALVLAGPGRYLWVRLTLRGNGDATPRITSIEIEQPRAGVSRFLPRVFRDSTPEDDFLRRWLSLYEETAWRGIAARMDAYAELFDPRTAPVDMLPYLAGWLEIPLFPKLLADTTRLRRVLARADELARERGTIDGIELAAKLYLDLDVQIVESFRKRSRFVLGTGAALDGAVGLVLGCDTMLTAERSPTYLDDEPPLGCSFLDECDERDGAIAFHFDVLVPARAACSSEDLTLLRELIEIEKPAFTTYAIRLTAPAGWVVGIASVVGQQLGRGFDRHTLDPATFGIAILNGPPRPKPIGAGFMLGIDSRLTAPSGPPLFQVEATVGKTTRLGA